MHIFRVFGGESASIRTIFSVKGALMEDILILCLRIALEYGVTDIHLDVRADDQVEVSMRVRGKMCRVENLGADIRFFRYLLYRADLDVSRILQPQTGRFEAVVDGRKLSLRMAIISGYRLASGVLRILNNHHTLRIDDLTDSPSQRSWMKHLCTVRDGLVLFAGPTGSGKTTTLYTILNEAENKKIFTLEDPVEVYSERYVQLQINERQNFGYAEGIKQLMRHDPDIIMIGEIRDDTAAEMAVRCALTGHLVLSTIHASDCSGTIERMKDLGVSESQLREVLTGMSCQRLYPGIKKETVCLYEIMDAQEVTLYFNEHRHSGNFISLRRRIEAAVKEGTIAPEEAAADLP